jgi:hypothetical protein
MATYFIVSNLNVIIFGFSQVLRDFKLAYDSSISVPPREKPVWPYTLDYEISHECKAGTCPTKSFPGQIYYYP